MLGSPSSKESALPIPVAASRQPLLLVSLDAGLIRKFPPAIIPSCLGPLATDLDVGITGASAKASRNCHRENIRLDFAGLRSASNQARSWCERDMTNEAQVRRANQLVAAFSRLRRQARPHVTVTLSTAFAFPKLGGWRTSSELGKRVWHRPRLLALFAVISCSDG